MALDPRIALTGKVPQVSQAINIFENAMMNSQVRDIRAAQEARSQELAPLKVQAAQQAIDSNDQKIAEQTENRILRSVAEFGQKLKPVLASGNNAQAQTMLTERLIDLQNKGLPTDETVDAITSIRSGNPNAVIQGIDTVQAAAQQRGLFKRSENFALRSNAPLTDPKTGQVSTPVFDPVTGQTKLVPIEGAIQETPTQKAERAQEARAQKAALEVSTTKQKETIKRTAARTSELKKEFSERRRLAARSKRRIAEAQKLAEKATQGVGGVAKVQLGRFFPGIDTSNEASLTGAFKTLALDELQKFTGPTTDFEFRVTEDIAGSLGDGAFANKARLKSLERASWFADRESKQFNDHIKAGHDPDEFFFNFNELVTPKKRGRSYSLQSLQDTAVANHISIDEVIKRLSR